MSVTVSGVKNPTVEGLATGDWTIQTSYNGNIINSSPSFGSFTVTDSFSPSYVTFNSVSCFPSNKGLQAVYTISVTFSEVISSGSEI